VHQSLDHLRDSGLRLATLTNNPPKLVQAQLAHSGLNDYFEWSLSVEAVRRFKPAPEVYRMAAAELGVEPAGIRLVAAHEWDVTGAIRAGCEAAFVARPGMVLGPLSETPDVVGPDLTSVAQQIIDTELKS
jgi:2-haloacid dehalogenase